MSVITRISTAFMFAAAVSLSAPALAEGSSPPAGTITVEVWNLQNDEGQVGCSLYSKKDGFPTDSKKAKARMTELKMKTLKQKIGEYKLNYNQLPGSLADLTQCNEITGQGIWRCCRECRADHGFFRKTGVA